MDPCKGSSREHQRCLFIHFVLTERNKICSLPSPPCWFPSRPPNKPELCRLKCSTRRCHQVEAPSQALPSLPGLMLQSRAGSEAGVGQPLLFPPGQPGSAKVPGEMQLVPWLVGSRISLVNVNDSMNPALVCCPEGFCLLMGTVQH